MHWLGIVFAGASAGVYAAGLFFVMTKRWRGEAAAFPALLSAIALFAFSRAFAQGFAFSALAALFLLVAFRQMLRAQFGLLQLLALIPICAMLIIAISPFFGATAQSALQYLLIAVLCLPAPIALAAGLRDFYLIRQTPLNRIR